ncbi:hypothetical protein K438DRAFT_1993106 [Mycena galopus ATCC 62051]|nr:hypothetical protein K438DRAFT_1993106 [Mycena galopus ATCC 62051]
MVSDFVSVDFGWSPTSLDGTRTARRFLKPSKGREGYLTCDDVVQQASDFMDILNEVYPEFEHHLVYNNATTHRKCPDGSLSARAMPKGPSKSQETNFGVMVNDRDAVSSQPIYTADGKLKKIKIPMTGAEFNGQPQPLYFPEKHEMEGRFKGMAIILQEHGLVRLIVAAVGFCSTSPTLLLLNPVLKQLAARGCWGYAKRVYRFFLREEDLERNVCEALATVPLNMMKRFGNHSAKFADAYAKGLNRRQAAWAARKYRGHRVIPESILEELEAAGYNLRKHIAKALQARSKRVQSALDRYNDAAAALSPPL